MYTEPCAPLEMEALKLSTATAPDGTLTVTKLQFSPALNARCSVEPSRMEKLMYKAFAGSPLAKKVKLSAPEHLRGTLAVYTMAPESEREEPPV